MGIEVGADVGAAVGIEVGADVGAAVGIEVGADVGAAVGIGVGARRHFLSWRSFCFTHFSSCLGDPQCAAQEVLIMERPM